MELYVLKHTRGFVLYDYFNKEQGLRAKFTKYSEKALHLDLKSAEDLKMKLGKNGINCKIISY